jgi:hypothetical protein
MLELLPCYVDSGKPTISDCKNRLKAPHVPWLPLPPVLVLSLARKLLIQRPAKQSVVKGPPFHDRPLLPSRNVQTYWDIQRIPSP